MEAIKVGINNRIGPIGRYHPPLPATGFQGLMVMQRIKRAFGGGNDLDVKAFKQRARQISRLRQAFGNTIIKSIGIVRSQTLFEIEQGRQSMIKPAAGGRATKQIIMIGKTLPDFPCIAFYRAPITPLDTQIFQGHTLAIKHTENIMIGHHEQARRIGKRLVFGIPAGIGMPMRGNNG